LEENMKQGRRRFVRSAMGVVLTGAVVGYVGVAVAAEPRPDVTIAVGSSTSWVPRTVSIETGETVTFDYSASAGVVHNRKGTTGPPEDTAWFVATDFKASGTDAHTFNLPGTYDFVCQAHPEMTGVITVTGEPVEPTPTPTATPTQTATPVPTARPTVTPAPTPVPTMNDRDTPAPRGSSRADTVAPVLSGLKLKARTRSAKVSFKLSESAAVTLRVKKGKKLVRTVRGSFRTGGGSITVLRLARGRYNVEIEARDARGNRAPVQRKSVKVTR
jgi:plastocyanin